MMLETIKHQDTGQLVVIAKLLTGYIKESKKITDAKGYIEANGIFDADFTAFVVSWQTNHRLTADGEIGPDTWEAIADVAPTCSTSKNRTSGYTFALQLLLGNNITPDGIYGQRTKAAVAALQSATGLSVDGVCGPKTWHQIIVGDAKPEPAPGEFVQPVDYLQGKPEPWAGYMYSNHNDKSQTMANSGCGPTAAADVVATLIDKSITPWTLAQLAMQWGDRTYDSGTAWSFFKHLADYYNLKLIQSGNFDVLKACLKSGGYVVCSMAPGYWTKNGHFICAWKFTDTDVYCNDPASRKRTHQSISQFKKECKQYFAFYPKEPEDKNEEPVSPVTNANKTPIKRGKKIVDISKYQANIDYDALIEDTALIILRAGYRGTGGKVKIDECFIKHATALKARGVRFGTYFYSIASTESKAREEAQAYIEFALEYNPLFWAGDFEKPEITTAAIRAFADAMRNLGVIDKVGAYVANHLYAEYKFDSIRDNFDFAWIPRYGSTAPAYKCDMWQFSSTGNVNGINGNVDMNRITGDGHPLEWFLGEPEPGTEPVSSAGEPVSPENPMLPTAAYVLVTGGSVNIRNAPGLDGKVYAVAHSGDRFEYGCETKNVSGTAWYKVLLSGNAYWISSKYSRLVE